MRLPFRRTAEVPSVRRIALEPGDSLLVTVPSNLTMEEYERIREGVADNLDGINVLVVSDNIDVSVISQAVSEQLGARISARNGLARL